MALLLQFSIALFTGMVAATLVPPVRRVIPQPVEVAMWVVLAVVCVIGLLSITNPHARELTGSVVWGVGQIITTLAGLLGAGVTGWLVDNRFGIATALTLACGADIVALALLRSERKSRGWQPIIRLYEWMELPRLTPVAEPVVVPYAIDELNRKWAAAMAVAGAAVLTWLVHLSIWTRDVFLPRQAEWLARATAAGRAGARAGLESLWASVAVRSVGGGAGDAAQPTVGRVVDISVLRRARSIAQEQREEGDDSQKTGRLAS